MKFALPEKLHIPAAIVAGVAAVWGVVQSLLPALLSGGKGEE